MSLNVRDRMTIQLAATPYKYAAVRETHAREQLGMGAVAFWAAVNRLLDDPAAEAEMPMEVRRLRRLRQARRDVRSAGRLLQSQ